MQRIARFEKVTFEQFKSGYVKCLGDTAEDRIRQVYERIRLPERATGGSAGYDFYLTAAITLAPGESIRIPTGIRCLMNEGWVLFIFPRSGLGFKYRFQLDNTVGVIDSDYSGSDNEGHIFVAVTNDAKETKTLSLKEGEAFVQGVFLPYGLTEDDSTTNVRNGGFGSTSRN